MENVSVYTVIASTAFKLNAPTVNDNCPLGFGSEHPGGANTLLCDGSVRFVRDTIEFLLPTNLAPPPRTNPQVGVNTWITEAKNGNLGVYQLISLREDGMPVDVNF